MSVRDRSPEASFESCDRPFSLTADPRFHFFSRSHRRAFETLTGGLRRGDRLLLLTGDLGVGKTTLCRLLLESRAGRGRTALVADALQSPDGLLRQLLHDLAPGAGGPGDEPDATLLDLVRRLDDALISDRDRAAPALVVIDEAQCLPLSTARQVAALAAREVEGRPRVQTVLSAQVATAPSTPLPAGLDHQVATRVRLLPLDRDECGPYVAHRLAVARLDLGPRLGPSAADTLHALSGGVPRLVNLIVDRAWRQAEASGRPEIDRASIEAAAAAHAIVRTRPRRFRWFVRRAS